MAGEELSDEHMRLAGGSEVSVTTPLPDPGFCYVIPYRTGQRVDGYISNDPL
jgi:hypothetical protein